jgi:hypothetical protein
LDPNSPTHRACEELILVEPRTHDFLVQYDRQRATPPGIDCKVFGQSFRTKFSDKVFGQSFRTKFLDKVFGQSFWTKFSDKVFGQSFRTKFSDNVFGQSFRTKFSDNVFGRSFRTKFSDKVLPLNYVHMYFNMDRMFVFNGTEKL